jgi:hypothetical protein
MSRAMIVVRLLAMVAAGSLSCVAALLAITSLAGGRDARADTAASFAPIAFGMAIAGALLGWRAFGTGAAATVIFGLSAVGAAISLAFLAPELLKFRPMLRERPRRFGCSAATSIGKTPAANARSRRCWRATPTW